MDGDNYTLPLLRNIAPLSKLITLTGGLIPLECPPRTRGIIICVRYMLVVLIGLGLLFILSFCQYFLVDDLVSGRDMQQFMLTLCRYLQFPLALATLVTFTWKRTPIYTFLQDWRRLEQTLDTYTSNREISMKAYRLTSILLCIGVGLMVAFISYLYITYMDYFITFASFITTNKSKAFYVCHSLEVVVQYYATALCSFGEKTTSFTYRHLALSLVKIQNAFLAEIESIPKRSEVTLLIKDCHTCTNNPTPQIYPERRNFIEHTTCSYKDAIEQLWKRFEQLSQLVIQAQSLFGFVLLTSYSVSFFATCSEAYFVLASVRFQNTNKELLNESIVPVMCSIFGVLLGVKVVVLTSLFNSLPAHLAEFQTSMSNTLNQHWDNLTVDEKQLFKMFLYHVRLKQWAATPLSLFTISTTILLPMTGLIATYVIVMLQTHCT